MTAASGDGLDYRWAVGSDPDLLALQFPPLPVAHGEVTVDGMRALFKARGFTTMTSLTDARPSVANRCALSQVDAHSAELVVQVAGSATRIAVPHDEPAWAARVSDDREILVLVCESAIEDGHLDLDRLERDLDAGVVLAARVPVGQV